VLPGFRVHKTRWIKKVALLCLLVCLLFICYQLFYGGRPGSVNNTGPCEILAHRGVHVNWRRGAYDRATGCEAQHIYKPRTRYIENTIASMDAAFAMGATIVEIDIRRTADDHLVVFHDYMLECRTNGSGYVRDKPLAYLKTLDIGFGYTHDQGKTFPFRGRGIGMMPTFQEVLRAFPDKRFLLDDKDGPLETTALLAEVIKTLPREKQELLYYWGRPDNYLLLKQEAPAVKRLFMTRREGKKCFLHYLVTLGLSGFPEESRGLVLVLRPKHTRYMWGWPYRFIRHIHNAGASFYLYLDTAEDAKKYAHLPLDGVVTDSVAQVAPYFTRD